MNSIRLLRFAVCCVAVWCLCVSLKGLIRNLQAEGDSKGFDLGGARVEVPHFQPVKKSQQKDDQNPCRVGVLNPTEEYFRSDEEELTVMNALAKVCLDQPYGLVELVSLLHRASLPDPFDSHKDIPMRAAEVLERIAIKGNFQMKQEVLSRLKAAVSSETNWVARQMLIRRIGYIRENMGELNPPLSEKLKSFSTEAKMVQSVDSTLYPIGKQIHLGLTKEQLEEITGHMRPTQYWWREDVETWEYYADMPSGRPECYYEYGISTSFAGDRISRIQRVDREVCG